MKLSKNKLRLFACSAVLFFANSGYCEELNNYTFRNPSELNPDKVIEQVIPSLFDQLNRVGLQVSTNNTITSYRKKARKNYELYDSGQWRLKKFYNSGALMFRVKNTSQNRSSSMELSEQELQDVGRSLMETLKENDILQIADREEIRFNGIQYIKDDIIDKSGQIVSSDRKEAAVEYRRFIDGIEVIGESLLRVHVFPEGNVKGFDLLWRPISGFDRKENVSMSNIKNDSFKDVDNHELCYFEEGRHKVQNKLKLVYKVKQGDKIAVFDAVTGNLMFPVQR